MSEKCQILHELFNKKTKLSFPFDKDKIPLNGIYILFEKGETAHNNDRIVRIGTHTGRNQLQSRLFQHFLNENKDRSIFRKNIGRAILSKNKNPFLEYWELDLTTRKARENFAGSIDLKKQEEIEKEVSKFIQNNFTFIVIPLEDKEKRLEIESELISTISSCKECRPSKDWLGNFSPKEKIKKSGLWLVNELWKNEISEENLNFQDFSQKKSKAYKENEFNNEENLNKQEPTLPLNKEV